MIIVQARMGSQRLPGKSLIKIKEKTILEHALDALLSRFDKEDIVVATSNAPGNELLIKLCNTLNIKTFAGDEHNVASRFFEILKKYQPEYFVRISADSPLIDANSVASAVGKLEDTGIVTTKGGEFPSGMNVEVFNTDIYLNEFPKFKKPEHFEHVTTYFYEQNFPMKVLHCPVNGAEMLKFSVDTHDDLNRVEKIFSMMSKPHYQYLIQEKCDMYKKLEDEND